MKNNCKQKIYMLFIAIFIPILISAMDFHYNKEKNALEVIHQITVKEKSTVGLAPSRGIIVFTPPAPFDSASFIIRFPINVSVNQPFTVDYSIRVAEFTSIPFWADLLPDPNQLSASGLNFISNTVPTVGVFNYAASSTINKGGRGSWSFSQGLPAKSLQHLTVTLKASSAGIKSYTSFIATNPPVLLGPIETIIVSSIPNANPDKAITYQNNPVIISVLDNDVSCSPLMVVAITQPIHGSARINADNTLTYLPDIGFAGSDSLTYTVEDKAGNRATGAVSIVIVENLPAMPVLN